jgi:MoaA/NifB/PqqE/SkfB family radical SAM enzyme
MYCQITILGSFYHLKIVSAYFGIIKFHVLHCVPRSPVAYQLKRFPTKTEREREREREWERETDRQTDRQTDRETSRQAGRQAGRQRVNFSTTKIKDQSITVYVTTITTAGNQNMIHQVPCYRTYNFPVILQMLHSVVPCSYSTLSQNFISQAHKCRRSKVMINRRDPMELY